MIKTEIKQTTTATTTWRLELGLDEVRERREIVVKWNVQRLCLGLFWVNESLLVSEAEADALLAALLAALARTGQVIVAGEAKS